MADDNVFLRLRFEGEFEPPKRFYAVIDQLVGDSIFLDAISADFFDRRESGIRGLRGWHSDAPKAPIFVIELRSPFLTQVEALVERADAKRSLDDGTAWLELEIGETGGFPAVLYPNLYDQGRPIAISSTKKVTKEKLAQLIAAFSLDDDEATSAGIEAALSNLNQDVDWVGVYDVGQGGANGLCDDNAAPLAYFDLGGGVLANTRTFPSGQLIDFCYLHNPAVVLSHWDWDHWSSGNTFPAAQNLKWVVPNQHLGAVHATFASQLSSTGNLLVWPASLSSVKVGRVKIVQCTGRTSSRNHSGLAIEVEGPLGQDPILLTGDARYSVVPGALSRTYTSLIAPHHGADMNNRSVPRGSSLGGARTAYSYGQGNTFGHPRAITEQDHHGHGWPHSSQGASVFIDRQTATRPGGGLGHIGLSWVPHPSLPRHACGRTCSVGLTQT